MYVFFVHGSKQLISGDGNIPLYQVSNETPDEKFLVNLDQTLQKDYELIASSTSNILFLNAPPTYLLGGTVIGDELESALKTNSDMNSELNNEAKEVLDRIIDYCGVTTILRGTKIYRVRLNSQNPVSVQEYDSPPIISDKDRFNIYNVPVFYGAFDVESCIHECRSTVYDEINLATFLTKEPLKVIDLDNRPTFDLDMMSFIDTCLFRSQSYRETQALSKRIFERSYDGIKYQSYFSIILDGSRSNIALFGSPVREEKVSLESINRIKLDRIKYAYTYGPVFDIEKNNAFRAEMDSLFAEFENERQTKVSHDEIDYEHFLQRTDEVLKKYM